MGSKVLMGYHGYTVGMEQSVSSHLYSKPSACKGGPEFDIYGLGSGGFSNTYNLKMPVQRLGAGASGAHHAIPRSRARAPVDAADMGPHPRARARPSWPRGRHPFQCHLPLLARSAPPAHPQGRWARSPHRGETRTPFSNRRGGKWSQWCPAAGPEVGF